MRDVEGIVETARSVLAVRARADAAEVSFLASLDSGASSDSWERRSLAEALAPELRLSPQGVLDRIHTALALTHRMPRLLSAMREGQVDRYGAERVLNVVAPVSDSDALEVDRLLEEKLSRLSLTAWQPRNMAWHASQIVKQVDPGAETAAARMAHEGRKVTLDHGVYAQSRLSADLPSNLASAAYARVDAMARKLRLGDSSRNLDQLRADVFADLLLGNDPGVQVPQSAAMVYLHMPIDTALSMSETGASIDGIGPIPAAYAREIMTNPKSIWRKVLCDPATGNPVDLGRSSYRPNSTIRKVVEVRDRMCVVPWCRRPARHCDFDHQQQWAKDRGSTSTSNAAPRCRRHHRLKNAPGWTHHYNPAHGTSSITTPLGVTYTDKRETVLEPRLPDTDDTHDDAPDNEPPPF
ncbi:HNH endonuclease signature motif containing protein [Saccharomonospora sp. CUA-673]|uniref:HNH endonuclease signature motif containing protein n=1 Tax=Saccharomonospora sp. CUA-673 TaxID=1904969 RepID=UPI00096A8CDA|nr:HNH endonuclease signature motif containing protein [Saccharomonospora sp. CUA-673]